MERSGPKSRRPIHDNIFPDEIRDNIKNDKLDKSKRMNNREVVTTDSGEDHITTDDENCENSAQIPQRPTETSKKVNEKPLRRSARKSSSSERVSSQLSSPQYGWEESLRSRQKSSSENRKKKENLQKKADSGNNVTKSSTETGLDKKIITGIFVGIVLLAAVAKLSGINGNIFSNTNDLQTNSKEAVLRNVKKALQTLGSKYKNQNSELWQNAYFGITNLIKEKNKKPSIILLLGKNSDPVDCLAALLGNVSSNALSSGTLQLTPDKFANNVGMVVESLRKQIKEKKVVIIWDLLNINTEALKAFHNLCDRINPLVDEVIYIITIIANNYDESMKSLEFIEQELFKKLSGKMKDDAIQPLITRITDGPILTVKPEPTITDCPLPKVSKY